MKDEFLTVKDLSEGFYMEKGSKFIGFVFPITTDIDFDSHWHHLKKAHPKARHLCWALRLNDHQETNRLNDDGEPAGSAGRPILNQLIRRELYNAGLIVVRYFGGTKLGIPGLIEAYRSAAHDAIEKAAIVQQKLFSPVSLTMEYDQHPSFINFCKRTGVPVFSETFGPQAIVTIGFRASQCTEELLLFMKNYTMLDFPAVGDYLIARNMRIEYIPGYIVH